ncbi:uncharacterized protein [Venturia canescens]|uniref:uncharacterized protein n=1 Tax=Venturia canescens TaxID=32260 RepID=UPI001C9C64C0|nr:uncharacterized protein LOC122419134 [Venturia canescens]
MDFSAAVILALFALASINASEAATIREDACTVSINYFKGDLKEPQPLLLNNEKNGTSFLYPIDRLGTVKLKAGQRVLIACPGKGNYIQGIKGLKNVNEIEASCLTGKIFGCAGLRFNFTTLACTYLPANVARRTNKPCYKNAVNIEIGFPLNKDFLHTIEICRDDETMMTYWSKYRLTASISGYQSGFPRPDKWQTGDFYNKFNVDKHFKASMQMNMIGKQIGSKDLASKYINFSTSRYLARGHLTAKADFVYGAAQTSTFWYVNAAPQWQTFNAGNWNTLEMSVRNFVARRKSDVDVYTGTFGHMTLRDVNGNDAPIYLYVNGTRKEFPVPEFYWKVIHDPVSKEATAFVGLNNPWAEKITEKMFICDNIADRIKWVNWSPKNIAKGISYVCDVDDLRKSIPYIPRFKVNDILV